MTGMGKQSFLSAVVLAIVLGIIAIAQTSRVNEKQIALEKVRREVTHLTSEKSNLTADFTKQKAALDNLQREQKQLIDEKALLNAKLQTSQADLKSQSDAQENLVALQFRGNAFSAQGNVSEAIKIAQQAQQIAEQKSGATSLAAAFWYLQLGYLQAARGQSKEAKGFLERGQDILDHSFGPDNLITRYFRQRLTQLTTELGDMFDPTIYKGQYVILHFWTTGSPSIQDDFLDLKRLVAQLRTLSNVSVIGISLDSEPGKAQKAVKDFEVTWPQFFDARGLLSPIVQQYQVQNVPYIVLIGPDGNMISSGHNVLPIQSELGKRLSVQITGYSQGVSGSIQGEIQYLKDAVTKLSHAKPQIELRSLDAPINTQMRATVEGAKYRFSEVPLGSYQVLVQVDANSKNPLGGPGDLKGEAAVRLRQSGETVNQPVNLRYLIHLTKPVDNADLLPMEASRWHSPVEFAWQAVPQATRYVYQISKVGTGIKNETPVDSQETKNLSARVKLPASKKGEAYSFRVSAFHDRDPIGELEIQGKGYKAGSYAFTVE